MKSKSIRSFFVKYWQVIFIGVVWLLFAYPYFIKGNVPYPSTYQVSFFPPWNAYPEFGGPVKNNAMPDVVDQIYPWKHFTITQYKSFQLPVWNPYNFAGNPHIANYQSAAFSPFNFLYLFFPFLDAWSIVVLLQPLIAAIGMYVFIRELQLSKHAAVFSSTAFMFCGFMVVWMAYGTLGMAVAFLPWILYGVERSFKRFSILSGSIISVTLIGSFFSGHFQTSLYVLLLSFGYLIFRCIANRRKMKLCLKTSTFFLFGVGVSLIQILPSMQFYLFSSRNDIFLNSGSGIPWHYLVTLFAPDFFGNPVTRNDWFGYYAEWASFIGIIPVFFAILAIFCRRNAYTLFFLIFSVVSLALAVESPLYQIFVFLKIPVLGTSTQSRAIVLFSFALAVLAGFGMNALQKQAAEKIRKPVLITSCVFCISMLLIWGMLTFLPMVPIEKINIAQRNMILPTILIVITIVLSVFFAISKNKKFFYYFLFLLLLLTGIDSVRYAAKWMPFDNRSYVFPNVPVIDAIKKNIGHGRVFGNLGTQAESYYGLPSIEGYDPLYIERYGEFIRTAETGKYKEPERSVVHLARRGAYTDRVLDFLGVSVIFHPIPDTNQGWAYPVWEKNGKHKLIYQDDKFQLFSNKTALQRASLFYNFEVEPDSKKLLERFYDDAFSFRDTLLLAESPQIKPARTTERGTAEILQYTPQKIVIKTKTNQDALLLLTDNYYPTWSATVNGVVVKIMQANYTFRSVVVPSGESIVEFKTSII